MRGSVPWFHPDQSVVRAMALVLCAFAGSCIVNVASVSAAPTQFGEAGSEAGQIKGAKGVAVEQDTGDVYVTDSENNRVDKFGPEGQFLLAWGWGVADGTSSALQTCTTTCFAGVESPGAGAGQFGARAAGIAVDNDALSGSHGDVYVLDTANHRIQKFGPEGEFILMFGGEVNRTKAETVGATEQEKNLCTAASGNTCQIGTAGTVPGEFEEVGGRSIALDAAGNVHVGDDGRVQQFSPGGGLEGQFAIPGVILLDGLAVDSADDTYVQTEATPAGLVGIHKYSGGLESGLPRDESGQPSAFALGSANDLYVVEGEGAGHRVLEYDPSGIQLASFDAGGEGGAGGIAYSEKLKALYLLNGGSVRIVGPPPPGPLVLAGSESATEIEPTSATLGAMVNSEGKPTEYHFEYGTTVAYGTSSATTELKGGAFEDLPASAAITNLQPSTAYHFRIVIHNASGTIDGPDQSFITVPPVSIDNTSASAINDKSARLEAELNPHGALTKYHFEFDTAPYSEGEPHHGIEVPILEGSAGSGTVDDNA